MRFLCSAETLQGRNWNTMHSVVMVLRRHDSSQLTPEEQQKRAQLKQALSDVLNNKEIPPGRQPAGRPIHRIKLIPRTAPSGALR